MIDIARSAGCSRATLYRYFPNREALHVAFVNRAVLRIAMRMAADQRDGGAKLSVADRILAGIDAVRSDPLLLCWVEPNNLAIPLKVSQDSELLRLMTAAMLEEFDPTHQDQRDVELRGAWMLRSIVSLLAMPGPDAATERAMVENFIVPVALPSTNRPQRKQPIQ